MSTEQNRTWHCLSYEVTFKEYNVLLGITEEVTETRYRVVDDETGKVLDDAQGYGYTTRQKAFLGYSWKLDRKNRKHKNKSC